MNTWIKAHFKVSKANVTPLKDMRARLLGESLPCNYELILENIFFNLILFFNFTILYWFCHISTWIRHRYIRVPYPEPSSPFPSCTIPLGRPSAPAPSIQYCALNLDWRLVSYMILYWLSINIFTRRLKLFYFHDVWEIIQ